MQHNKWIHCVKICWIILLLSSSNLVFAASWYRVEVIIFKQNNPLLDGEQWQSQPVQQPDKLVQLKPSTKAGLVPYKLLPRSQNRLNGIYQRLQSSSQYQPLLHLSWQQPQTRKRNARYVHLQRLDGQRLTTVTDTNTDRTLPQTNQLLDGAIRIRSGFYLHVDIDLVYFTTLPLANKMIRSEGSFLNHSDKTPIRLKESRKIKLNELHYFDHPLYGVIVQVRRL